MEIKISTKQILNILLILSWILVIGICIEAGGFIANAFFALANPSVVTHLWQQVDLSDLFKYDRGWYFVVTLIMSIVAVMKAWLFFVIIKILNNKDLNIAKPFSKEVQRSIFLISYIALLIGLLSGYGVKYIGWLIQQRVKMPDTQLLHLGGADVWLFMAIVLFIIAQIFKRGIEIQTENELTV